MRKPEHGRAAFDALEWLLRGRRDMTFLEVGMTRGRGEFVHGDGWSTPFFAYLAAETGSRLTSVDVSSEAVAVTTDILRESGLLTDRVSLVQADALEYLAGWNDPVDVLYLDAWDYAPGREYESAANHLAAFQLVERHLRPDALFMVDDVLDLDTLKGKGQLLIPYLLAKGFTPRHVGYAFIMSAASE